MVCLGDGLSAIEWQYLRRQWQAGFSFDPVKAGELTWLWSEATVDALMTDYPLHGTWPGFRQIAHLVEEGGIQIHCICRAENMSHVSGPLLVPNSDLLPEDLWRKLRGYRDGPVVLLGRLPDGGIDERAVVVRCRISPTYVMACVVLNSTLAPSTVEVPFSGLSGFTNNRPPIPYSDRLTGMFIPPDFWERTVEVIRYSIAAWEQNHRILGCQALNRQEGLRTMTLENQAGILRTALVSCAPMYLTPQCRFNSPPVAVTKISTFPYTPLFIGEDSIHSGHKDSPHNFPLHIPPYGIIVMDVDFAAKHDGVS
jgi:hypothetical protein